MRIRPTESDSDPSRSTRAKARTDQHHHISRTTGIRLGEVLPLLLVLFVPLSVHAGFFSSLVNLFETTEPEASIIESSSYAATETPLLSAIQNSNPSAAIGGGDVTVSEGTLVSTGPVGEDEIADSEYRSGEIRVYTVDAGDTLSQIADMYGVTTNTIIWANDLRNSTDIQEGDVLVILPIVGVQHTVAAGESLSEIVAEYEADLDEVLAYNNLDAAADIAEGDELMIPGGEIAAPATITYATPVSTSGGGSSGGFSHPVPGATRTQGIHGYNGVDLAAGHGTPIRAAAAGEVIVSKQGGWNGGYGNYVVVRHGNGTQTLYAHNSSNNVAVGQWVSSGQVIAYMGNTGRSTGTHLHFEVRGARNPF